VETAKKRSSEEQAMDTTRMGLGTDQLEMPTPQEHVIDLATERPPVPRAEVHNDVDVSVPPGEAALAGLAPWARRLDLPGIDT
jgi:hypothetical protein